MSTQQKEQVSTKFNQKLQPVLRSLKEVKVSNPVKSVGLKLFLIIFVSIVSCVLAVGFLAFNQTKNLVEENVSEASLQTVKQIASNLDVVVKTYEDLTLQVVIDPTITLQWQQYSGNRDSDAYDNLLSSRELSNRLTNFIMSNSTISGIAMIPLKDTLRPITAGTTSITALETIAEQPWFQKTVELNGKLTWIEPQASGLLNDNRPLQSIGVARIVKTNASEDSYFVLVLEMTSNILDSRYVDVNLGTDSELFVIDSAGNYIVNPNKDLIGKPAVVNLNEDGNDNRSGRPKLTTTDGQSVLAAYQTFSTGWKMVGTIPTDKLAEQANVIRNLTLVTALFAVLLAIAIGALVILTIAKPLVSLRNLMVDGAGGNLTVRSSIKKRSDEIGQLSDSFNDMMSQITVLAKQTTKSADEVLQTASELTDASKKTAVAAKEIAVATEEIAGGATSLAVEAEKGTNLTSSINEQMKQVIEANEEMTGSATDMEKASGQGTAYMAVLIEKTGATEEMTRSMVEKVEALKDSTGSIVKILDVLNNLTKQTNILSLNATIEAARAGAAGKGFMVVADEIRKLAEQSRQSIDVVGQITEKIQKEIVETVDVLSEAYPMFQEQINSVKEANTIFMTVQAQMGQFIDKLEHATASIGQLDQSQTILSEAMSNVSAVAEESSATSEEVASLSTEQLSISEGLVGLSNKLDAVSQGLKESLSKFKV